MKSSFQAALPNVPANAYPDTAWGAIAYWHFIVSTHPAVSREEIIVWVPKTASNSDGVAPWHANGIKIAPSSFNEHTFPHEVGHHLGLSHTFGLDLGAPDPETGGVHVLEDYWDLIYGVGPQANPGPVLFKSKSAALAHAGPKYLKDTGQCTLGPAPECSMSCPLRLWNGSTGLFVDGSAFDNTLRFKLATDSPPASYARGTNVMMYVYDDACKNNGITASQAQLVRKYLKHGMMQHSNPEYEHYYYLNPLGPQSTDRDLLGFRQVELAPKLDFDGDGKREVGVFKPPTSISATGTFSILLSTSSWLSGGALTVSFGKLGDIPVPADYDGDGRTDIAVFRTSGPNGTDPTNKNGYWIYCPSNGSISSCANPVTVSAGDRGDVPIPGTDFDGNPATGEMAYFRPSNDMLYWRIEPFTSYQSAEIGDTAGGTVLAMHLDSDNKTDIVRYRPKTAGFGYRLSTENWASYHLRTFTGASRGSYPVRTTNAGKDVFAIYDPVASRFRTMWTPLTSAASTECVYGQPGDTAISSSLDLNGDSKSDMVLFKEPNANGDVRFTTQHSGSCAGDNTINVVGPALSNRVVLFTGQDASGDGKPDLWMLNTHTMQWKFLHSQWFPGSSTWGTINWGDARDIPL